MSNDRKEYMYNFTNGGWNTEFATSADEAYKRAVDRWNGSTTLVPIRSSFVLVEENEEQYKSNLRSFW